MRTSGFIIAGLNFVFAAGNFIYGVNYPSEMAVTNWILVPINALMGMLVWSRIPAKK